MSTPLTAIPSRESCLHEAITLATDWQLDEAPDGACIFTPLVHNQRLLNFPSAHFKHSSGFIQAELDGIDPRLYKVLFEQLYTFEEVVSGDMLRQTMALWNNQFFIFPEDAYISQSSLQKTQYAAGDTLLVILDPSGIPGHTIKLEYTGCVVGATTQYIPLVLDTFEGSILLSDAWMDNHYPAWRKMVALEDTVGGMSAEHLAQKIFNDMAPSPDPVLAVIPNIDFD